MVSRTLEYALRAMSHLATLGGRAATNESIASATDVPRGYLSKVMRSLVRGRLVRSYRGLHGGFSLARDADSISVLDIVNAVDPIRRCRTRSRTDPDHGSSVRLEARVNDAIADVEHRFGRITLGSRLAPTRGGLSARSEASRNRARPLRASRRTGTDP